MAITVNINVVLLYIRNNNIRGIYEEYVHIYHKYFSLFGKCQRKFVAAQTSIRGKQLEIAEKVVHYE